MRNHIFIKSVLLTLIAAFAVSLSGCDLAADRRELRRRAVASSPTINIGVVWPFESSYKSFANGITMASDEINLSGGVLGRKLNLIMKDDGSTVTGGMVIADSLAADPAVCAAIGFCDSYVTLPVSYIYDSAGMLMMTTASTAPGFNPSKSQFLFRTVANGNDIARKIASVIAGLGFKKAMLCYVKNDYGLSSANACEDELVRRSISVVDRRPYISGGRAEFDQVTDRWKLLKFDCVIVFGDAVGGSEFVGALRAKNIEVPVFCGDAMNSPDLLRIAGAGAAGAVVSSFFNPAAVSGKGAAFVSGYNARFKSMPDSIAANAYDGLMLLAAAIKRAGSADPPAVAKALRASEEQGVANVYGFDAAGDLVGKKVFLKIVRDGKFVYLDASSEIEILKKTYNK